MESGKVKEKKLIFIFYKRVYDLEAKKSLEEIIKKSKLKAKYNEEARNYTELIEDLEFPIATNSMSLCSDGKYMWASGIYPPQIHCYELEQLTMKMSRHIEKECLKLLPLSNDFRKLILLTVDRTVEIHAHFGSYYKFRLPVVGRDMIYHPSTAEMLFTGSSNEIYRFNLEEGLFKKSYECLNETTNGINSITLNPIHDFITIGCDNGFIECIDHRQKKHIGILNVSKNINQFNNIASQSNLDESSNEITSLSFDNDGIKLGVGTLNGQVALFDIRKNLPILIKDHFYDEPIKKISFFNENVISSDTKVIKIWNKTSGDIYTNLEPPSKINDFLHFPNSGMIFVAGERQKIKPYYIPSLGPAPKWCSFVDK